MRKTLTILLVLVLAFGVLTATVSAEEYKTLDKIELTVTGYAIGKAPADVKVEVPAGANYAVKEIHWQDETDESITAVDGTFTAGRVYLLSVIISYADGYEPVGRYTAGDMVYTINGQEVNGFEEFYSTEDDKTIVESVITAVFHDRQELEDSLELCGVTAPAAGAAPTTEGITVPADANYEIAELEWREEQIDEMPAAFEDGKAYYLDVTLKAKDGYIFPNADDGIVLKAGDKEVCDYGGLEDVYKRFELRYSLKKQITKVEITDLDVPVAGQTADTQITVNGEGVAAEYELLWYDMETYDNVTTFADKGLYNVSINLEAQEGYEFAESVALTVNGKTQEAYGGMDVLWADCMYSVGYETVKDTVAITFDPIQEGQKNTDVKVYIDGKEAPANTVVWGIGDDLQTGELMESGAAFKKGEKYLLAVMLAAPEGKLYDDATTVTINGKTPAMQENYLTLISVGAENITVEEKATTPATGDNMSVGVLIAVMAVSGLMLVVLPAVFGRKERF